MSLFRLAEEAQADLRDVWNYIGIVKQRPWLHETS